MHPAGANLQIFLQEYGPLGSPQTSSRQCEHRGGGWRYAALWLGALVCAALAATVGLLPWVLPAYALLSLCCGAVYWYDKRQAQAGAWRTPESTLHWLALLGGWPGALLAQQWLRHKSSKTAFRRVFWCTVALNLLALVALHLLWFRPTWLWR